jgi:hypothetical protein
MVSAARTIYAGLESSAWPSVSGTILTSQLVKHDYTGRHSGYYYLWILQYKYSVDGFQYFGNEYMFGSLYYSEPSAPAYFENHPVGSDIIVHYEPKNSGNSVIMAGSIGQNVKRLFALCFVVWAPFGWLIVVVILQIFKRIARRYY